MKLTDRKFGVEIEFTSKRGMSDNDMIDELRQSLRLAGVNVRYEGYTHDTTSYWKIVPDGSCGWELVSPILQGNAGLEELEKAVTTMNQLGHKVNASCGFHVHHDARDLSSDQITAVFALAMKWETVIDHLVAPSRINNSYCHSNTGYNAPRTAADLTRELQRLRRRGAEHYHDNGCDRFLKVNYQAYLRHGTIEFRQHQGTLDFEKMVHWIVITQNLVTKAIEHGASWQVATETAICFKRFRDALGCNGQALEDNRFVKIAAQVMIERWRKFRMGLQSYSPAMASRLYR